MGENRINSKEKYAHIFIDYSSDVVEAFTMWVGLMCGNKGIILHNDERQMVWFIHEDADKQWDDKDSKKLELYTTKELMKYYYDKFYNN